MRADKKSIYYVALQFFLLGLFVVSPALYSWYFPWVIQIVGYFLITLGVLILLLSFYNLGKNLSPFPRPKEDAVLITSGIYRFIRHPIYTAILLGGFGLFLISGYLIQLMIYMLLCLLFWYKSKYEEELLTKKFPDYEEYKSISGRFLPKM